MADNSLFRTVFPEFADLAQYSDAAVDYYLGFSLKLMNADRWGELLDHGQMLQTAHYLARARAAAASSARPGAQVGVVSSKSVGPGSISYDNSVATEQDAGHWNSTTYGTQYIRLARQVGAGPVESGQPQADASASSAWPGVIMPW